MLSDIAETINFINLTHYKSERDKHLNKLATKMVDEGYPEIAHIVRSASDTGQSKSSVVGKLELAAYKMEDVLNQQLLEKARDDENYSLHSTRTQIAEKGITSDVLPLVRSYVKLEVYAGNIRDVTYYLNKLGIDYTVGGDNDHPTQIVACFVGDILLDSDDRRLKIYRQQLDKLTIEPSEPESDELPQV